MKQSIAILITNFEGGGAQKVAITQAQLFQDLGYKVHIIALEHQDSYTIPSNLSIHFLSNTKGQASKFKKLLQFPLLPLKLAQYLKQNQIPLCISHLERADFINILAKPFSHHLSIGVIHSHLTSNYTQEGVSFRSTIYLGLVKLLERFHTRIITVSRGIKANLIQLGLPKDKIQVILNPFDIDVIKTLAQQDIGEYASIYQKPVCISTGRLSRQKGFWHSILAFHTLKKTQPDIRYVILGDGPLREYHRDLAKNLGLKVYSIWDNQNITDNYDIYFMGFQQNPFAFIAQAKVLILPSHYEGLPNVLVESLIIGTPVIASDSNSGPRELLAPNTDINFKTSTIEQAEYGILIPLDHNTLPEPPYTLSQSEHHLVSAMELILGNDEIYNTYRQQSSLRIQDFAQTTITPQWKDLLQSLLNE